VGKNLLDKSSKFLPNIGLPNKVMFDMMRVASVALHPGTDVLIGMDILGLGEETTSAHVEAG